MDYENHWSDCPLNDGPARRPGWCNCGGFKRKPSLGEKLHAYVMQNWLYFTRQL